ncbi:hypothetical protein PR002_g18672 [Phytophthora rubi]|uniref:RRM domain-containing protein n=1 Tax=Phytophthora rubi TaxID=129364 RepID=A0A6A3JUU7_9STRA|nr:hypothetical protein PR002_g18672 [Phytophthora rubi]
MDTDMTGGSGGPRNKLAQLERWGGACGPQREGEEDLVPDLTAQQWATLETGLTRTKMQVVFSMDEPSVAVGNLYWTLRDFDREILSYCKDHGVRFEDDRLDALGTDKIVLFGRPDTKNKELWCLMKRGYIYVRGVRIWVQPSFTGRKVSNLSLCEIEYVNTNEIQPSELIKAIQTWGGTDALVVSHAVNVGTPAKWPAIMCLRNMSRTSPELLFAFRLFFPSPEEANAVYAGFLQERRSNEQMRDRAVGTLTLKPVSNVEWSRTRAVFFRPTALEHASFAESRIIVAGFSAEVSAREIEEAFERHDLGRATVEIRGPRRNYAVAELANRSAVTDALERFGEESADSLRVGDIPLRIKKMNDPNNQGCYKCRKPADGNEAAFRLVESMVEGIITQKSRQLEQQLAQVNTGVTALTERVAAAEARQQAMEGQMTGFLASLEQKMAAVMRVAVHELHESSPQHRGRQDFGDGVGLASVDAAVDSGGLRGEVEAVNNSPLVLTAMLSSRERDPGDESGADTDISVGDDQRAAGYGCNQPRFQRAGQKHRRWDPMMLPAAPTNESRRCSILRGILQREHYSGDFIGDDVLEEETSSRSIRICTTNINKNLRAKLSEEVADWFISHEMDIMVVSDAGLGSSVMNQVWVDTLERTTRARGLVLTGAGRVGMIFNTERWGNRICRKDIVYSESRRSMRVKLRLPRRHSLWVIGTYIHHAPERHQDEVVNELAWIQEQCVFAREKGAMIAVGGDFNTYPDSTCEHVGPGNRSHQAENMSARFKAWTDEHALSSSFRLRHPTTIRYTYERAATKSALDDI